MTSTLIKKHQFDTVFDSQKVFRLLLEAMSNPLRRVTIREFADKLFGEYPAFLAIAMTLLDNEMRFSTCENKELSDEISTLTLAAKGPIDTADFIFVCDPNDIKSVIGAAKCGTLSDPHKSAIVIIRNDESVQYPLTLIGPGIDGIITPLVSQIVKDTMILRDMQYYEYPQGIDLIFITSAGELFAIPRSTRMEAKTWRM